MEKVELEKEQEYLDNTLNEIENQINDMKQGLDVQEEQIQDFRHYIIKEQGSMDSVEIQSNLMSSDLEIDYFNRKSRYLRSLYRIRHNPYFGRIDITSDDDYKIYIGITYLEKDGDHIIYDWRSPVANLFYDSEHGNTSYEAPDGTIDCFLHKKRQYKIKDHNIISIFDNDTNINDEVLQQVLSNESSDKMKNIVNTIQKEQNTVIRDITSKHMIVEGIAGSGKTSVALHRIAYLLYKMPNLKSNKILIFSPNNIFSIYISNVLPELGEDNTNETTYSEFSSEYIKEYKKVESFTDFISRYYTGINNNDLIKIKQSDLIVDALDEYVNNYIKGIRFTENLEYEKELFSKELLNDLFFDRYSKLPVPERIEAIADYICNKKNYARKHYKPILSKLNKITSFEKDFKKIYSNFYKSDAFRKVYGIILDDKEIDSFVKKDIINYEDSILFIYLKGLIQGFPYSNIIEEVVIDEAQDYSKLQYRILKKIFKRASFTLLGDVNQTVNPFYKYDSLESLKTILEDDTTYIRLTKTYRSSKEIIDYSNKILGLDYAVSIRKSNERPVIQRNNLKDDMESLRKDIKYLQTIYKKTCIITKDNDECNKVYEILKKDFNITNMNTGEGENPNLIIVPSFLAKGLEFDSVIIYNERDNCYYSDEKYLYYVAVTRAMHELIVYNNMNLTELI